jgi:Cu(I)/Ag(I) efflux system membrane protein CusA/SilA
VTGALLLSQYVFPGLVLILVGTYSLSQRLLLTRFGWLSRWESYPVPAGLILISLFFLAQSWLPLGVETGTAINMLSVGGLIAFALLFFKFSQSAYPRLLGWCLQHKRIFSLLPLSVVLMGGWIWSQMGEEFMPPLDEGSFLYMPTTMPHASIGEALDMVKKLDMAVAAIPEVELIVGKLGRVDSSLDPAPISMFENIINYKSEYIVDAAGHPIFFQYDPAKAVFVRDEHGQPIPDERGRPFRQWRSHIHSPDDIWDEIVEVAKIPGMTSAPKLQPIAARIVMLQSGMRAPMGVKVRGPSLEVIDQVGQQIETFLKEVQSIEPAAVVADRVIGKPYLEISINRAQIARYGLTIKSVQDIIEVAIGGKPLTLTVEGRERYPVRIRYLRELRDDLETLGSILIPTPMGQHIPLRELAEIRFERRAQVIKSEDTFLTSYVVFDKKPGYAEVGVVEEAQAHLQSKIASGAWQLPAGVSYTFAGSYENQLRAKKRLSIVVPLTLFAIFLILYLQFRSSMLTLLVFSGIFVAWSGGFVMLWLYAQDWFLNVSIGDVNFRALFQVRPLNLSVAVWVGFIALFGIATDDGVLMATYIKQRFERDQPTTREEIRAAVLTAATRRIRPALMTTATTLLALLPVLTSRGRGADIMVPMAIPSFGGMVIAMLTVFVVPVLYCGIAEFTARRHNV